MSDFILEMNTDHTVKQAYKGGQPHTEAISLESPHSIVTIYFRIAAIHLAEMKNKTEGEALRFLGIQAFLMALTGLEAFINTYYHVRSRELNSKEILDRVSQTHGSLTNKIRDLIKLSPDGPLVDQENLIDRVYELTKIRHEIVHPHWVPSSLLLAGQSPIKFDGLVQNPQAMFEDLQFCHEALMWCLLVIARIGQTRGDEQVGGFMFLWTANYDLTLSAILAELSLSENGSNVPSKPLGSEEIG